MKYNSLSHKASKKNKSLLQYYKYLQFTAYAYGY